MKFLSVLKIQMQYTKEAWGTRGNKEGRKDKYIVVVYKEVSEKDGFVITSFITRKKKQVERRKKLWEK